MFNEFIWRNYKESKSGGNFIDNFKELPQDFLREYLVDYYLDIDEVYAYIDEFLLFSSLSNAKIDNLEQAKHIFHDLCDNGIDFDISEKRDGSIIEHVEPNFEWFLQCIVPISLCLYLINSDFFKPYLFIHKFRDLISICDEFGIELPEIPKKSDKQSRFAYYWGFCESIYNFQIKNNLDSNEICAFLYDFAPKYLSSQKNKEVSLPNPTNIWLVGANKTGGDFNFLDGINDSSTHFWQGNLETKKGDIIIMYCLSPRSYIHSIWRATSNGIADPFFIIIAIFI
ncbi:hypothetical protein [Moraxella equi]|uniref:Uncharacterized protein n=1 Tax=Moraxella equi TaxID=60442 RepID=A0A378QRI3_9GAMM|nr:hypothetical protein [Moraxella equi]OPH39881.1 hypothetical protein B5J93_01790 [Moraxella equi]STZ03291.1 Uncharacterised protein [Moraxella equi]